MSTILIADDDPSIRKILSKAMKVLATEVIAVADGQEALDFLQDAEDLVLIVSDWMMPRVDGGELLRRVKEDARLRDVPFLMLTARGEAEDVTASFEAGADEYVRKPYSIGELLARAKTLIKMKELQDQLRYKALRDGLTGLYNHQYFMERLENETSRAERYHTPLSLFLLDVDLFKGFNDSFGHQAGDVILEGIGRVLADTIRKADVAARYGGEEFALLLPSTPAEGAEVLADRLLVMIREQGFLHDGKTHHVTVSIGVGTYENGDSAASFLKRVDQALYQAKEEGRDRVCIA